MKKFFTKHRTPVLILLGYVIPALIIVWLIALYFLFGLVFPSTSLSKWFLEASVRSILLYLLWLLIWTLSLVSYAILFWTRQPLKAVSGKVGTLFKNWGKNWRLVLLLLSVSALLTIAFSLIGSLIENYYHTVYFGIPFVFYRSFERAEGVYRYFSFYSLLGDLLFWFLITSVFYWLRKRFRLSLVALFLIWAVVASIGSVLSYEPVAAALSAPSSYLVKYVKALNPWERYWAVYSARSEKKEAEVREFLELKGKSNFFELTEGEKEELRAVLDRFDAENPKPAVKEALGVWRWALHPIGGFFYTLALSVLSWGMVGLVITGVGKLGLKGFQRLRRLRVARY